MTRAPSSRIGPYEIRTALGAGGMGQVYGARDTRLDRDVALKILPYAFTADADRLGRFEREAKTLASLNHPNIAHIYDTGKSDAGLAYLAMELVEGRTLDTAIRSGNIEVGTAVSIARQIAEALEAAHEHGIIHRDLKPANVIVRDDDVVKVLDFGLAKAMDPGESVKSGAEATRTSPVMTQAGWILGTAAYMSPEQARGRAVDRRADIWAFGVVLFELLTGKRLFEGESISDVVVAVLTQPIELAPLPAAVPPRVRELIGRCLERDPKRRLRDIGEARLLLESPDAPSTLMTQSGAIGILPAQPVPRPRTQVLPWAIAAIAVVIATALVVQRMRATGAVATGRMILELGPPPDVELVIGSNAGSAIISPDGSTVAFLGQTAAGRKLFVRSLATGETRAITGAVEASYPFWSPDSRSLGFFSSTQLMTVAIAGGLPEAVAPTQTGRGGTWTDNGVLLFTPVGGGVIHRVPERGGTVEQVTTLDASRGENAHYFPVALPGGQKFLFFVRSTRAENNGIYLGYLDGKTKPVRVVTSLSSGVYVPGRDATPGRLLWVRDGQLLAQTLDIDGARLTGEVTTVASDVRVEESQRATFASVSNNGTIVWASARAGDFAFAWFDRTGRRLDALPIASGKLVQPRLSPDDKKLVFTRVVSGMADLWLHDIASGATTQVTTDPEYDENATWSPDSRMVAYQGNVDYQTAAMLAPVDGSQ
ncbi:MAG TPA: protein kinase, partial [Vicinamibacterales bacterium]